ncbi:uncharacterized protein [Dermacentor albipictus]|uniref:uncharacterized protein n=1 Tax=Dermacentor albipictus TaxID=60249 RepID=UPI0038FCF46A
MAALLLRTSCWCPAILQDGADDSAHCSSALSAIGPLASIKGPAATLSFGEAAETARRLRITRSSTTGVFEQCPDLPACWPSATLRWLLDAGESHAAAAPRAARTSPGASLTAAVAPPAIPCCRTGSRGLLFL